MGLLMVVMIILVVLVTNLLNKVLRDMEVVKVAGKGTVDLLFISGSCSIETMLECTAYFGGGLDDDFDENGSELFFC